MIGMVIPREARSELLDHRILTERTDFLKVSKDLPWEQNAPELAQQPEDITASQSSIKISRFIPAFLPWPFSRTFYQTAA